MNLAEFMHTYYLFGSLTNIPIGPILFFSSLLIYGIAFNDRKIFFDHGTGKPRFFRSTAIVFQIFIIYVVGYSIFWTLGLKGYYHGYAYREPILEWSKMLAVGFNWVYVILTQLFWSKRIRRNNLLLISLILLPMIVLSLESRLIFLSYSEGILGAEYSYNRPNIKTLISISLCTTGMLIVFHLFRISMYHLIKKFF